MLPEMEKWLDIGAATFALGAAADSIQFGWELISALSPRKH
jgi:hypothetical protein